MLKQLLENNKFINEFMKNPFQIESYNQSLNSEVEVLAQKASSMIFWSQTFFEKFLLSHLK